MLVENLSWRYAIKEFDSARAIDEQDLITLKRVIQLSPSSFGLQPYKVIIISDLKKRKELYTYSWKQRQIIDASHLFLFCHDTMFKESMVDEYIEKKAKAEAVSVESLRGHSWFIKGKMEQASKEEFRHWASKQAYLALGTLLSACAELKLDACPMEGFDVEAFNDSLGLREMNLSSTVLVAIGHRSNKDKCQYLPKTRKSMEELFLDV